MAELAVSAHPIPPVPDFRRAHGPITRFLLRRTLLGLLPFWLVGLVPVVLDAPPRWQAVGLGLLLPGGGQLYAGAPVWAAVAFLAVPFAAFLWWLCGPVLLPPAAWLTAAALAPLAVDDGVWSWVRWGAPTALVTAALAGAGYVQLRFRRQLARGRAYNERLAEERPLMPASAPPALAQEADAEDVKTLRWLMDLALQPIDRWDGFFFVRPDQFREGAVRYQLNFVSYCAAMYAYTRTPAFTGYLAQAQRNVIEKMMAKPVWRYWALENLWGNMRWNPDPIVDDNIMYSGYLGLMLGLYETTTGDTRYHEPECLQLRWNSRTSYRHDFGSIADALTENFGRARLGQYPCEPNWIYPMCNTFGVNALLTYDRLRGTDHAAPVVERLRRSYDNGDFCEPDGRLTAARSEYFGFRHPMVGDMGDGITTYFLNSIVPDIGRRTWWLNRTYHTDKVGTVGWHSVWNNTDPGNYGINTDRFTRALLAANAREYGDDAISGALTDSLAHLAVEQNGARRYRSLSVWGNLYLALARFGREDSFRGLVNDGFPEPWRTGPRLSEATYPDVIVTHAVTDGASLDVVLQPGSGPVRTRLVFDRLHPHRVYAITGATSSTVEADAGGRAVADIELDGRRELRLTPRP